MEFYSFQVTAAMAVASIKEIKKMTWFEKSHSID